MRNVTGPAGVAVGSEGGKGVAVGVGGTSTVGVTSGEDNPAQPVRSTKTSSSKIRR